MGYMYSQEIIGKKKKTKRIKPELIIEEKYITLKKSHSRKLKNPKKVIEFEIADDSEEIIVPRKKVKKIIEPNILGNKRLSKKYLKKPIELEIMEEKKRYNEEFIELMEKLNNIMLKQGEPFRARAYQKAQETIMNYPDDINSPSQLKGLPGIGSTIMDKLNEYVETNTLRILEREKNNPMNILTDIYGVGPKKAEELVNSGIKSISQLRENEQLLNDIQKIGLQYYEDILERIPRGEIEEYKSIFEKTLSKSGDGKMEIVGSYRRGLKSSGDIDVIITSSDPKVFTKFIDILIDQKIILHVLSRGPTKCLVITKMFNTSDKARRVDFLYTTPEEFPFAILYFTGSKIFNTVMRQYALNKGYTFNEHYIYHLENKKKGAKVSKDFKTEKDIFDFLGLQFKTPIERRDGRSVVPYIDVGEVVANVATTLPTQMKAKEEQFEIIPVKKNKTLKKRKTKPEVVIEGEQFKCEKSSNIETDILRIVEKFKHNGISILETLDEEKLTDIIRIANKKYYNQTPIMTDNQYDIVTEFIEHKFPNNHVTSEIGAEVERNKVKLPYEMASMDKIKPDTNALSSWMNKFRGPYVLSCKLDGVSGLYTTEGSSPKLYTRGNGKVGQDVSHLIPFLRLPKTKNITIRGEFIISKKVFEEKYKTTFANPRNMVAGIINHKHISDTIADLHFVAYEVIVPELVPSKQIEYLKTINVESVLSLLADKLSNEILSNILIEWRKSYIYEIDGIIVTDDKIYPRKSGNPDHAFAFKMVLSEQIAEAKVVDVLWSPSKDGYLKPRVQIEPISLGGVTIEFATGFNAAFIKDNNIGIGTTIELIRSGDVIPYIKSVTVPSEEPKMPSVPYKWNDTHVDIMLENASEDPTVKEKNITGFFRGIGVEGLSSGNIARLIKAGFSTVPEIIGMSEADFLNVEGFKGKMANKIYTGIHQGLQKSSIIELMAASNIFGRGFSEKKMELILNELPNILVSNESNNQKIKAVASVKGMASKTAEAFVYKIEDFKYFLKECGLEDKLYEKNTEKSIKSIDQLNPLFGKTIVLTGTRDKNIIEFLKNMGVNQGSTVSKNTFLVIAKHKDEDTGKAEEARKLNIPIMSVEEFIQTYINK
jgi:DNA ligase (NAD+)